MQAVLLLLLLAGASKGLDFTCDATQDATCYGALGGPVYLQLMGNTTGYGLDLYRGDTIAFISRFTTVFNSEFNTPSFHQRWQFVPDNGTLIINPVESTDSGAYRVEIYKDGSGLRVGGHTVQLIIKAAAISPVFISVWLAEIIILTSLLVGGYCLRNKRSHTPDECEDREMELTPTSMSHRRRRTPEEVQ